jgi:hypothetical protein
MTPAINRRARVWPRRRKSRHPVKLTALLYLKEALITEEYEECRAIIEIAKDFGAEEFEILNLLEDRRRNPV